MDESTTCTGVPVVPPLLVYAETRKEAQAVPKLVWRYRQKKSAPALAHTGPTGHCVRHSMGNGGESPKNARSKTTDATGPCVTASTLIAVLLPSATAIVVAFYKLWIATDTALSGTPKWTCCDSTTTFNRNGLIGIGILISNGGPKILAGTVLLMTVVVLSLGGGGLIAQCGGVCRRVVRWRICPEQQHQ
jgi:hypothetical protein